MKKNMLGYALMAIAGLAVSENGTAQDQNYVSEVWVADMGNGKYHNPVPYTHLALPTKSMEDIPDGCFSLTPHR